MMVQPDQAGPDTNFGQLYDQETDVVTSPAQTGIGTEGSAVAPMTTIPGSEVAVPSPQNTLAPAERIAGISASARTLLDRCETSAERIAFVRKLGVELGPEIINALYENSKDPKYLASLEERNKERAAAIQRTAAQRITDALSSALAIDITATASGVINPSRATQLLATKMSEAEPVDLSFKPDFSVVPKTIVTIPDTMRPNRTKMFDDLERRRWRQPQVSKLIDAASSDSSAPKVDPSETTPRGLNRAAGYVKHVLGRNRAEVAATSMADLFPPEVIDDPKERKLYWRAIEAFSNKSIEVTEELMPYLTKVTNLLRHFPNPEVWTKFCDLVTPEALEVQDSTMR
jgi:hypothetical protein